MSESLSLLKKAMSSLSSGSRSTCAKKSASWSSGERASPELCRMLSQLAREVADELRRVSAAQPQGVLQSPGHSAHRVERELLEDQPEDLSSSKRLTFSSRGLLEVPHCAP